MNKGSQVKILGLATAIFATSSINYFVGQAVLASDSEIKGGLSSEPIDTRDCLAPPDLKVAKLALQATLTGPKPISTEGDSMMRYMISVDNYQAFAETLFQPATYLKPLGEHLNSSRTWVYIKDQDGNPLQTFGTIDNRTQLKNLWFAIESNTTAPNFVYVDIWDRQTDTHFKSALLKIKKP